MSISCKMKHCVGDRDRNSIVRWTEDAEKEISQAVSVFRRHPKLIYDPDLRRIMFGFLGTLARLVNTVVNVVQHDFAPSFVFLSPLGNGNDNVSLGSHECVHEFLTRIRRCKRIHRSPEDELARYVKGLLMSQI
jgi:hypothetical protein